MRSYLARHQPQARMSETELRKAAAAAWHRGWLIVRLDDVRSPVLRDGLKAMGERLYGPRDDQ